MARKILLADDSVTAQNMGRKILADAGYEVITVNNGSAALKKIAEQKPDLIVLDVYMPGYSGLEVCQRVKEAADTSRIPILLTVGKLEPFKPEEARRVRADGYIVKPFEASELLSALSKLEDKVVPRAESSKPGRFARATAAIEEGRYDKSMAVPDDDTGWKRRISFPTKKKEKEKRPEDEVDTAEIYNPVNKDLRTVVEHKAEIEPTPSAEVAHPEDSHVNLGALAPEGLPKDVTPEEIAALAAAAAQIQGKVIEEKPAARMAEMAVNAPTEVDISKPESIAGPGVESAEPAKTESKEETRPSEPAPLPEISSAASGATFAESEKLEKNEEIKPAQKAAPAEVMASIAGLETEWVSISSIPGNGSWGNRSEKDDEPVTMAVAETKEPVPAVPAASRWTAIATALAPEEAGISLEQEMQKAYAAFAAAESGHAAAEVVDSKSAVQSVSAPVATGESSASEIATTQAVTEIPAASAPQVAQPLAAVSEAATEAVSAAVQELEAVAAKYEAEQKSSPEPVAQTVPAAGLESAAAPVADEPKVEEAPVEEKIVEQKSLEHKIEETPTEAKVVESQISEPTEQKSEEEATELKAQEKIEEVSEQPVERSAQEVAVAPTAEAAQEPETAQAEIPGKKEETVLAAETPEVGATVVVPDEKSHSEQGTSEHVKSEAVPVSSASTAGGIDDMAKRETETAAAWASWRKIRETGSKGPEPAPSEDVKDVPEDRAAMAVAVGAESSPEDATNYDADPEIASIVDSVLADMRPKIVEEIARKLGKKK